MKVRQAYEGRVIEARCSELNDGGWNSESSIEEHETTGVTETAFCVPGVFPTPEAAIEAAVAAGQQKLIQVSRTNPLLSIGSEPCTAAKTHGSFRLQRGLPSWLKQ